jgi:hypothetical protein
MKPEIDPVPRRARPLATALVAVGLVGLGGVALAHEAAEVVVITAPVTEDLYVAGKSVDIRAERVEGDITVAGQTVVVSSRVTGDVMAAGQSVTLTGALQDDLRAAGRSLTLSGSIGDHVVAAGDTLVLADGSRIGGFAWLAGSIVDIGGEIGGDLVAAGQTVTLTGTVGGNVEIDAADAVVGDSAHIHGDLSWPSGKAPKIEPGARIDGRQIELPAGGRAAPTRSEIAAGVVMGILFGWLSLLVLTSVLRAVTPPLIVGAGTQLRARPGRSLGAGALALIVGPIVAILGIVTLIGAPLGIVILLAYAALLMISIPVVLDVLTDLIVGARARKGQPIARGWRFGALALIALVFAVVLQVPILGGLVGLAAILLGLGALVLRFVRRDGVLIHSGTSNAVSGQTSMEHEHTLPGSGT